MAHQRKPDGKKARRYVLSGGIPWPELGDGTPWKDGLVRVHHKYLPEEKGRLQHVEWCHPDGSYMKERETVRKATKTLPERRETNPGEWYGIVSWDNPDRMDRPAARQKLVVLLPDQAVA